MRSALGFCCLSLAASLLQFTANTSTAAVLPVDAANGPYYTVQSALNVAVAGDTVHVKPGVYRERVSFPNSGTSVSPIVLEGEPGTVLDGSNNVTLNWTAATDIGTGVYRATVTGFTPFTVTANGKIVSAVTESKCDAPTDPYYWPDFFANGFPAYGWTGVKGIVMWHSSASELLIRFDGALNPNSMAMTVAPRAPIITISGKNYCTVRGMTLRNGANGIDITTAVGCIIENCVIGPVEWGINLKTGSDSCRIRSNEIFENPYTGADPFPEASYENWNVEKIIGEYNRWAICTELGNKGGHEVSDNYVHDDWDGINLNGDSQQVAGNDVHHNRVYLTFDNAVKLSATQANVKFHDNVIEWTRRGTRLSEIATGPLFVYRNIYLQTKSGGIVVFTKHALAPAEVWVYHNTNTSDDGIYCDWSQYAGTATTPNYHFYNNIFWCNRSLGKNMSYLPNWTGSDYDLYVRARTGDRPWTSEGNGWGDSAWNTGQTNVNAVPYDANATWNNGIAQGQLLFVDSATRNMALRSTSQARAIGLNLAALYGGQLPGCGAGYFTGTLPDVGALQYGEPMPVLPRGFVTELESASRTASDAVTIYNDVNANAGQWLWLNSNAVNDYITFTVPVIKTGTYAVKVRGRNHYNRGITKLLVDSTQLGGTWDTYAPAAAWTEYTFGTTTLSMGSHTFKFQITGKNASSSNYNLGLDTLILMPPQPVEIIKDNTDSSGVTITGSWTASTSAPGYYGTNYIHDGNANKGSMSVRYTPTIPSTGSYQVFARWTEGTNRASNVPIDITYSGGSTTVSVDERSQGGTWVSLGTWTFAAGTGGNVLIRNAGTNGYVIADAIRFVSQ